ncbi:MAG: hypothetical protein CBD63_01575 [Candidatus Pelagibacter sp. TMED203]|jgi:enoyl-[acyl-carrier-protein] reductase (NADH)|nr:MAG: hypothetical protein CBD63_01575 [Candidatus Pelagibacter sp. TMED203]|tara:strand:- start:308 stop:586 length:279 start_codon:yes stop_codon:yes gene_type:complete
MDWSSSTIALGVFLTTQAAAAVWWASETDTKLDATQETVTKVVENATDIAVIQNDVVTIKEMMEENEERVEELREMMHQILYSYKNAAREER